MAIWTFCTRSPNHIVQRSTKASLARRRSMVLVRLSALVSARNVFTSSGLGISPVRSSVTRRRNSVSLDIAVQRTPSCVIFPKISTSMKFAGTNGELFGGATARWRPDVVVVGATSSADAEMRCHTAGPLRACSAAFNTLPPASTPTRTRIKGRMRCSCFCGFGYLKGCPAGRKRKKSVKSSISWIRRCGLAPGKARNLKRLAQTLVEEHGGKVPRDIEALERLPGVGHKTASVVMTQAFGEPAFPVDTHIHRLAVRWGLSSGKNVKQTEADLKKLFPPEEWGRRHLQLIYFGRQFCPARGHDAEECPICSWGAAAKLSSRRRH